MPELTPHSDCGHGEEGFREAAVMVTNVGGNAKPSPPAKRAPLIRRGKSLEQRHLALSLPHAAKNRPEEAGGVN